MWLAFNKRMQKKYNLQNCILTFFVWVCCGAIIIFTIYGKPKDYQIIPKFNVSWLVFIVWIVEGCGIDQREEIYLIIYWVRNILYIVFKTHTYWIVILGTSRLNYTSPQTSFNYSCICVSIETRKLGVQDGGIATSGPALTESYFLIGCWLHSRKHE